MKTWVIITISVFLLLFYIFVINIIPEFKTIEIGNKTEVSNSVNKITFSDSISVTITRNRWYGTIYESGGNSYIYLFKLIRLPIKEGKTNYIIFHIFALMMIMIITLFMFIIKYERRLRR